MRYALWAIAAFEIFAALIVVGSIGKPREPLKASTAFVVIFITAGIAGTLIAAGLHYG